MGLPIAKVLRLLKLDEVTVAGLASTSVNQVEAAMDQDAQPPEVERDAYAVLAGAIRYVMGSQGLEDVDDIAAALGEPPGMVEDAMLEMGLLKPLRLAA